VTAKLRVQAGSWHSVPLDSGRHALAFIARGDSHRGPGLIVYFFGPFAEDRETVTRRSASLLYTDAVQVTAVAHHGLQEGRWPVIGEPGAHETNHWPNPIFANPGAGYRRLRDDKRPNKDAAIWPSEPGDDALPKDGYAGAIYMEKVLDQLLTEDPSRPVIVRPHDQG
jgi:hypothetical protein